MARTPETIDPVRMKLLEQIVQAQKKDPADLLLIERLVEAFNRLSSTVWYSRKNKGDEPKNEDQ